MSVTYEYCDLIFWSTFLYSLYTPHTVQLLQISIIRNVNFYIIKITVVQNVKWNSWVDTYLLPPFSGWTSGSSRIGIWANQFYLVTLKMVVLLMFEESNKYKSRKSKRKRKFKKRKKQSGNIKWGGGEEKDIRKRQIDIGPRKSQIRTIESLLLIRKGSSSSGRSETLTSLPY